MSIFSKNVTSVNVLMKEYPTLAPCSGKGLKIMNLAEGQTTASVADVLQNDDDDAVDPHLERIKNEAGGEESDEEVVLLADYCFCSSPCIETFYLDFY